MTDSEDSADKYEELFLDSKTGIEDIDNAVAKVYDNLLQIEENKLNERETLLPFEQEPITPEFFEWFKRYNIPDEQECIKETLFFLKDYTQNHLKPHQPTEFNSEIRSIIPNLNNFFDSSMISLNLQIFFKSWETKMNFIRNSNSQSNYCALTKIARAASDSAQLEGRMDELYITIDLLACLEESMDQGKKYLLNTITEERKKGNPKIIDRIVDSLENNVQYMEFDNREFEKYVIQTLHLITESVLPLARKGYNPEADLMLDLLTRLKGPAIKTLAETFRQGVKRLKRCNSLDVLHNYFRQATAIAGNYKVDLELADLKKLANTVKDYHKAGLSEKIQENLTAVFRPVKNREKEENPPATKPKSARELSKMVLAEFFGYNPNNIYQIITKEQEVRHRIKSRLILFHEYPYLISSVGKKATTAIQDNLEQLIDLNHSSETKLSTPQDFVFLATHFAKKTPKKVTAIFEDPKKTRLIFEGLQYISNNSETYCPGNSLASTYARNFIINAFTFLADIPNVAQISKHLDLIAEGYILEPISKNLAFLESNTPPQEKRKILEHLVVLKKVKDLQDISNPQNWHLQVMNRLGFDSIAKSHYFLDTAKRIEHKYRIPFTLALPAMLESNVNLYKALEFRSALYHLDFFSYTPQLCNLINSDLNVDEKRKVLLKLKKVIAREKSVLTALPLDDFDNIEDWHRRATQAADNYIEQELGARLVYPAGVNKRLAHLCRNNEDRAVVTQICRAEEQNEHKLIFIPPGKEYGREFISKIRKRASLVDATLALVYGLISRNPDKRSLANSVFESDTVKTARMYVSQHRIAPGQLFKLIQPQLQILQDEKTEYHKKRDAAKKIKETIHENYVSGNSYSPQKHALKNLLTSVDVCWDQEIAEYSYSRLINTPFGKTRKKPDIFDQIACINQKGTIQDLFEGRRLFACTFLSEDKEVEESAGLYYHADYHIALQHLIPFNEGKPSGLPIGVSILADCETTNNRSVLLIDSAEGGEILQRVPESTYMQLFLKGLIGAAQDTNSEYVFVPEIAINTMAKKFRNFFKKTACRTKPEKLFLRKKNSRQLFNLPQKPRYLETFQDRTKLSEIVEGYLITTQELADIYTAQFSED